MSLVHGMSLISTTQNSEDENNMLFLYFAGVLMWGKNQSDFYLRSGYDIKPLDSRQILN